MYFKATEINPNTGKNFVLFFDNAADAAKYAPPGATVISADEARTLLVPPPPTPEQLEAAFEAAVSARLDVFAQEKGYDNMDKARLAALTSDYAADGQAANAAYNATWVAANVLKPQVRSGTLTAEQALSLLPTLAWS
ncbi:MAG: hypothetical protein LBM00_02985 [Deltaproteobacteria bacterium]|jgi:hypothetical protein|nr:hypothetical protein [Deltaproteobacteria bacterium]